MSKFKDKIIKGQAPTPEEWNDYLREAHETAPRMTPKVFEAPLTKDGLNSYGHLANEARKRIEKPRRILDLACGDGHFTKAIRRAFGDDAEIVGIDMSPHEIDYAARSIDDPKAVFKVERADRISEPDGSFDLVLCHMAVMLMVPLEPVLSEMARVLRTGGVFAGVINGAPAAKGFIPIYAQTIKDAGQAFHPDFKPGAGGDPRTKSSEEFRDLLNRFFEGASVRDFETLPKMPPDRTAEFFRDMYNVSSLPDEAKLEFNRRIVEAATAFARGAPEITFEFPLRYFEATAR